MAAERENQDVYPSFRGKYNTIRIYILMRTIHIYLMPQQFEYTLQYSSSTKTDLAEPFH